MDYLSSSNHPVKIKLNFYFPLIAILALVCSYIATLTELAERWTKWDESLSHGLVIVAAFLIFLYKTLPWPPTDKSSLQILAIPSLFFSSGLWYLGSTANITIIEQFSLLFVLIFFFASTYSFTVVFKLRILFCLLIFAIPIWDQLNTPLVNLSGLIVGKMVSLVSIPATIEGNSIFIPSGHIVIADGCSGLRYLEISMALGFIICLLNNYREKQLIPVLVIAIILGLLANWLRIFILVMVGYFTEMKSSLMKDHEYFGWALFAALCFPALYLAPVIKATPTPKTAVGHPQKLVISFIGLTAFPLIALFTHWTADDTKPQPTLVNAGYHYSNIESPLLKWPHNPSFLENGAKKIGDRDIYATRISYKKLNKEDKLVPYINHTYDTELWILVSTESIEGKQHNVFRRKNSNTLVAQIMWYNLGKYRTASVFESKLLQIPALMQNASIFTINSLETLCEQPTCNSELDMLSTAASELEKTN